MLSVCCKYHPQPTRLFRAAASIPLSKHSCASYGLSNVRLQLEIQNAKELNTHQAYPAALHRFQTQTAQI